jgi:hypothetical protein
MRDSPTLEEVPQQREEQEQAHAAEDESPHAHRLRMARLRRIQSDECRLG